VCCLVILYTFYKKRKYFDKKLKEKLFIREGYKTNITFLYVTLQEVVHNIIII
jgi:hypothetical protein